MKTRILLCMMALWAICAAAQQPMMRTLEASPASSSHDQVRNAATTPLYVNDANVITLLDDTSLGHSEANVETNSNKWTVTLKFEYDESNYYVEGVAFYNDESWNHISSGIFDNPHTVSFLLQEGKYDFCLAGGYIKRYTLAERCYIIKEEIEINSDTTIIFNHSEADKEYSMISYSPDGKIFKARHTEYADESMSTVLSQEEGNVFEMCDEVQIRYKNYYLVAGHASTYDKKSNFMRYDMFKINDVSDRYKIVFSRTVAADSMYYVCQEIINPSEQKYVVENDPNDFVLHEETFQPPLSSDCGLMDFATRVVAEEHEGIRSNGTAGITFEPYFKSNKVSYYVDGTRSQEDVKVLVTPKYAAKKIVEYFDLGDGWIDSLVNYSYIIPPYAMVSNNEVQYIVAGGNELFMRSFGGNYLVLYPGSPYFSYTDNEKGMLFGASCPINVFSTQLLHNGNRSSLSLYSQYVGMLGEIRESDLLETKTTMNYNGELVCDNYNQMTQELVNLINNGKLGEIDITLENQNFKVDELQGKNTTKVHFVTADDWNLPTADWAAPTLQMLWFKNTDGTIIDQFETSGNGLLEFAGGDFIFIQDKQNPRLFWNECLEQTVEVEYSPYNEDNWNELMVEEIPENFYMPSFGYFYRGSLESVSGEGLNGWFDLKIRLTDAAGNWQEQVLSPAFRIDDHAYSSVATMRDNNAHEVARYNLAGQRVDTNATGVVIIKMSDGTARKIIN